MENKDVKIRNAEVKDFEKLYKIGRTTPEFKVSAIEEFMEPDEFLSTIKSSDRVFLIAEAAGKVIGFIYADYKDIERGPQTEWACLVYLVVVPGYRNKGIAQLLYNQCIQGLKNHGVTHIYGWANSESDGSIIKFMKKNGFTEGHKYIWMDKKI